MWPSGMAWPEHFKNFLNAKFFRISEPGFHAGGSSRSCFNAPIQEQRCKCFRIYHRKTLHNANRLNISTNCRLDGFNSTPRRENLAYIIAADAGYFSFCGIHRAFDTAKTKVTYNAFLLGVAIQVRVDQNI